MVSSFHVPQSKHCMGFLSPPYAHVPLSRLHFIICTIHGKGKGTVVPVIWAPCHKGVLGSGDTAPRILDLGTRWRWVISFTPRPLYSKVKVSPYLNWAPRHRGVLGSGGIAPRILDLGTRWRGVVSFSSRPLHHQGKSTWYPLDRRSGTPHWQAAPCELEHRHGGKSDHWDKVQAFLHAQPHVTDSLFPFNKLGWVFGLVEWIQSELESSKFQLQQYDTEFNADFCGHK
jgi:hypothetical protein